ncbi:MAG: hypothetical protein ABIH92_02730 [Nanoarchaeota archaeon]
MGKKMGKCRVKPVTSRSDKEIVRRKGTLVELQKTGEGLVCSVQESKHYFVMLFQPTGNEHPRKVSFSNFYEARVEEGNRIRFHYLQADFIDDGRISPERLYMYRARGPKEMENATMIEILSGTKTEKYGCVEKGDREILLLEG